MELEVRVPVLSAHIAVTCPIVSQAPTRRTFMIARGKYEEINSNKQRDPSLKNTLERRRINDLLVIFLVIMSRNYKMSTAQTKPNSKCTCMTNFHVHTRLWSASIACAEYAREMVTASDKPSGTATTTTC